MAGETKLLAEWFWTDRWIGSSASLLPIEPRGLYREMLTQAWRRGCRLPNDHEAIRRVVGCTPQEWKRCWPKIERHWRVVGDDIVNDTQLEVYAEAVAKHESAQERGRRGGIARAQALAKLQAKLQADGQANTLDGGKPPSPSPSPIEERSTDQERSSHRAARTQSLGFAANGTDAGRSIAAVLTDPELADRAGKFVYRYGELFTEYRKGAKYHSRPALDYQEALGLCATWDDGRLETLAVAFLTTDDKFCRNGSASIAQFRSRASWCDSKLREKGL